jgi:hypothetical protein
MLGCAPGELEPGIYRVSVHEIVENSASFLSDDDLLATPNHYLLRWNTSEFTLLGGGDFNVDVPVSAGAFSVSDAVGATQELDASCAATSEWSVEGNIVTSTSFSAITSTAYAYEGTCENWSDTPAGGHETEVTGEALDACAEFDDSVAPSPTEVLGNNEDCGHWNVAPGDEVVLSIYLTEPESKCTVLADESLTMPYGEGIYTNLSDDGPKYTFQVIVADNAAGELEWWLACADGTTWAGQFSVE